MRDPGTIKRNKYLATHMRQPDITPGFRTAELYVPNKGSIDNMPIEYIKRNLCHKAQGDVEACRRCPAPCMIGKALQKAVTTP